MPVKKPDPIYLTDEFPRDGCTIVVDVLASGYRVALFAPGTDYASRSTFLESTVCRTSEALAAIVECMATGKRWPANVRSLGLEEGEGTGNQPSL